MDPSHFDALARALSSVDSRRRLLASLAALPLLGDLFLVSDHTEAKRRKRRAQRQRDSQPALVADKKKRKKPKKKKCQPESVAQTCAGRCGSVANNCKQAVDCGSCACDPACDACFRCQENAPNAEGTCVLDELQQRQSCGSDGKLCQPDGTCACVPACSDKVCGPDGCGESCGTCDSGQVCTTAGQCCTPTTCAAIYQEMCQYPEDCDVYGICGTFDDGCGGTIDCGNCTHPCISCQDHICRPIPGGEVCGANTCCFNQCCVNASQGVCGLQSRCLGGNCCPLGWSCCDARDGSGRSSCYNIQTYCQGQGLLCCGAGNTCCQDEPCCTSDAQCTGGRRCIANGAPSTRGCCSYNF